MTSVRQARKTASKSVFLAAFLSVFHLWIMEATKRKRRGTCNSVENRPEVGSLHDSLDGSLCRPDASPRQANGMREENTPKVDAGKYVKRAGATPRSGPRCGPGPPGCGGRSRPPSRTKRSTRRVARVHRSQPKPSRENSTHRANLFSSPD